jgi:hypothetical protein
MPTRLYRDGEAHVRSIIPFTLSLRLKKKSGLSLLGKGYIVGSRPTPESECDIKT